MARVFLLAGGNTGDVKRTLQAAQQLINARVGAVMRCSHRYESDPWGFEAAERFCNQALEVSTDSAPRRCSTPCRKSNANWAATAQPRRSKRRARAPVTRRGPSTSTSFFTTMPSSATERLTVPHPLLEERLFALLPLCEIARSKCHPVTGRTVGEMLENRKNEP